MSVSFVTLTVWAKAWRTSTGEEVIPGLPKQRDVLSHKRFDLAELGGAEARAVIEAHRLKPVLCPAVITLNVHMPGFLSVR